MKKIISLAFIGLFLVACGGGGSSASSSGFAPANASAFETKFIGQTLSLTTDDGNVSTITIGEVTQSDNYIKTGSNAFTLSGIINGLDCRIKFIFTSELAGTISFTCIDNGTNTNASVRGTFTFSGSN